MISSLLMLSLTAFVGCACVYGIEQTNERPNVQFVDQDDVGQYASNVAYVDMYFYGEFIHANVVGTGWEWNLGGGEHCELNGKNINGQTIFYTSGSYLSDAYVAEWMRTNNALFCTRFYDGGDNSLEFTPFWSYLNINGQYNDTFYLYVKDVRGYNPLSGTSINRFSNAVGTWGTWELTSYKLVIDPYYGFTSGAYIINGGQITFGADYDNTDDVPSFDFAIGCSAVTSSEYQRGFDNGYQSGKTDGYNQGKSEGYDDGYHDGEISGDTAGYQRGFAEGVASANNGTFNNLFNAIADTPIVFIRSLFNFDLFGMNMFIVIMSLLTGIIVIYVIKKVVK